MKQTGLNILVVGSGGREHTLVWKLQQSPRVAKIYCAPGNAGIASMAECVPLKAEDISGLKGFAQKQAIDLTIVGPENPLVAGIVDAFSAEGLAIFGPSQRAAVLEGSKKFAKDLMAKYQIPTAKYAAFQDLGAAQAYFKEMGAPCVVKADGLAAGKGVVVAFDLETAQAALQQIMADRAFGEAGNEVVIEEYLEGEEVSVLAFTDGEIVVPMPSAQDHKRVFDGDQGANTGGMGAYSPAPVYTTSLQQMVEKEILEPVVAAMAAENRKYIGVLYAGLMITPEGPKVLEFNARFGDPETQVIVPRLKSDLVDIVEAVLEGRLAQQKIEWQSDPAVCVVMAAGGYPQTYETGQEIQGLGQVPSSAMVFHAGTGFQAGKVVSNGGRVLGVTALGSDLATAIEQVYRAVESIDFPGCHYRRDIGFRALQRLHK